MERLFLAVAIVAVVAVVAEIVRRRRQTDAPTQRRGQIPVQLDRADFTRPDAPWLVVVFTSDSCSTCADVASKVAVLESSDVAVEVVAFQADRDRHARYAIDTVPTLVVAGSDGAVRLGVLGPINATDLWAAVADLRDGG